MIEYTLIRSDRKTLAVQIKNGEVIVRAPRRTSETRIRAFADSHAEWIERHLAAARQRLSRLETVVPMTESERKELIKEAKRVIPERVAYYAELMGVTYGRVSIRSQHTRWGSCTSAGNLSFNLALMLAPAHVMDGVIVHELCHRKHMDHSKDFYAEIESILPDHRERRAWLKRNGDVIMRRVSKGEAAVDKQI
jgi:predicted metal-dependent hydrolase